MPLVDLWNTDRQQIFDKRIDQLISFAGEGKLQDGNSTCREFRELLAVVPSQLIGKWIDECLTGRFADFGFVLQDITNEIGSRLGFVTTFGVYRAHAKESFDGLWRNSTAVILVETKSTTAYSISLDRIGEYRRQVAPQCEVLPEDISILLVVGDSNTGELESQVRGSKLAWSVRLIGVGALFRLLQIKESLDDPQVESQIQGLLVPQEFTRLDGIIDLVFATAEDVKTGEVDEGDEPESFDSHTEGTRANFSQLIIPRLEKHFGTPFVRQRRVLWASPDEGILLSCQVSKRHSRGGVNYWFGLKLTTEVILERHPNAFCVFGLGDPERVLLIPFLRIQERLSGLFTSPNRTGGILHWHIRFREEGDRVYFLVDRDQVRIDVSEFLVSPTRD